MIIYANLLPRLQAETVGAIVYILNLTLSDVLGGDYLRHVVDSSLGQLVNANKLLLNTLRAYRAIAIVYDYSVLRGQKFDRRGQRGQLVGYEDSIYRIWILLVYKVVRLLYCQFVESGKLSEIPGTTADITKEFNQQFEKNVIEARGKALDIPIGYTIETVEDDSLLEADDSYTAKVTNPTTEDNALQAVNDITEL